MFWRHPKGSLDMTMPPALARSTSVSALTIAALVATAGVAGAAPTSASVAPSAAVTSSAATSASAGSSAATSTTAASAPSTYVQSVASLSTLATAKWRSGAWVGGYMSAKRANRWGTWRGSVSGATPTFPERGSWRSIERSTWHIATYKGFRGLLIYGMPLLPNGSKTSDLRNVAAGKHDATFRKVARDLRAHGRGNSVVRIGWEANGTWWAWSANASQAKDYRNAFRRAAKVMNKEAPGLQFAFDINCGSVMPGQTNRLDALTKLYPGNDVVDIVGCSAYDWAEAGATNEAQWRRALHPRNSVGIGDVSKFARAHGKRLGFGEWGLAPRHRNGNGDNPFFIKKMHQFFNGNRGKLVYECYFNEPDSSMSNSLWAEAPQNPKSAAMYRKLW